MKSKVQLLLQLLFMPRPWALRQHLLNRLTGFDLAPCSSIGFSLLLVGRVPLATVARIGHLNVFKVLDLVALGEQASIGRGNWVSQMAANFKQNCQSCV